MPEINPSLTEPSDPAARPADPRAAAWHAGRDAARANALPGLVLSVFAAALLLTYWYVPPVTAGLERLGAFKVSVGWPFAMVSTAVFGGLLPGVVQRLRPRLRHTMPWKHLWFLVGFWAVKGMEVDLLYRFLAWGVGDNTDPGTLIKKIVFDMGIYCPLWAVPTTVLGYAFKDAGFSLRRTFAPIRTLGLRGWYIRDALPVAISSWAVWVPAVCVIYCLPLALQLPVQNLVLCFWSLLVVLQVRGTR